MHISSGQPGGQPRGDRGESGAREASALRAILRLAELDDGSGFVLDELEATLAALDDDVRDLPSIRVAALPFLAEIRLGLGDDADVAALMEDAVDRALAGDAASRVVVLRILRSMARMDAVELRDVVKRLWKRAVGADPVLATGLQLAAAVLDAVGPGAHPLAFPRLPGRFADRVLMAGDPELLCFFADVEIAVHGREKDDRRIAEELDLELHRELAEDGGAGAGTGAGAASGAGAGAGGDAGTAAGPGCGGAGKAGRADDFGDAAPGV